MALRRKLRGMDKPKLMKELCGFIEFHSIAKQLSWNNFSFILLLISESKNLNSICFAFRLVLDASKIVQLIQMILFFWSCAALCLAMLIIKLELVEYPFELPELYLCISFISFVFFLFQSHDAINFTALTVSVCQFFWAFGPVFISCELCERMSGGFDEVCDQIMKFKWYSVSIKIQKTLVIIMQNV